MENAVWVLERQTSILHVGDIRTQKAVDTCRDWDPEVWEGKLILFSYFQVQSLLVLEVELMVPSLPRLWSTDEVPQESLTLLPQSRCLEKELPGLSRHEGQSWYLSSRKRRCRFLPFTSLSTVDSQEQVSGEHIRLMYKQERGSGMVFCII